MEEENIKTEIDFYIEGSNKPFYSFEEFNELKEFLCITEHFDLETNIKEIMFEDKLYEISKVKIAILKETTELHMKYGIKPSLLGNQMPYNFRVSVYIKEKGVI